MKAVMRIGLRVTAASALVAGTLTVALISTAPAHAAQQESAAAPCRKVASANSDNVRLWWCNGTQGTARGYHAQAFMNEGGRLTLRNEGGAIMRSRNATHTGVLARWYNTSTFDSSGIFKACSGSPGFAGVCTRAGS